MLQNPCKTLGFKKNIVWGEVNHIQPVAYTFKSITSLTVKSSLIGCIRSISSFFMSSWDSRETLVRRDAK